MSSEAVVGIQAQLFSNRQGDDVALLQEVLEWIKQNNPLIEDLIYYCDGGGIYIMLYYLSSGEKHGVK